MKADDLALVSVVSSAILGLAGLSLGYASGSKDRAQAFEMSERERQQSRLAETYIELLLFVEEVGAWAQTVLPVVGGNPADPSIGALELPGRKQELSARARVAAFGSSAVRLLQKEWEQGIRDIRAKLVLIQLRKTRSVEWAGTQNAAEDWADWSGPWSDLESDARPRELSTRTALQLLVADELAAMRAQQPRSRWGKRATAWVRRRLGTT